MWSASGKGWCATFQQDDAWASLRWQLSPSWWRLVMGCVSAQQKSFLCRRNSQCGQRRAGESSRTWGQSSQRVCSCKPLAFLLWDTESDQSIWADITWAGFRFYRIILTFVLRGDYGRVRVEARRLTLQWSKPKSMVAWTSMVAVKVVRSGQILDMLWIGLPKNQHLGCERSVKLPPRFLT